MHNPLALHDFAALAPEPAAADRPRIESAVENSSTLKAFAVLEILVCSGRPMTLADLIQATGVPKASLYRTLSLFEEARLVVRESGGRGLRARPASRPIRARDPAARLGRRRPTRYPAPPGRRGGGDLQPRHVEQGRTRLPRPGGGRLAPAPAPAGRRRPARCIAVPAASCCWHSRRRRNAAQLIGSMTLTRYHGPHHLRPAAARRRTRSDRRQRLCARQ